MPSQLRIIIVAIGDTVAETEHQQLVVLLEADGYGDAEGQLDTPFTQQELSLMVRVLDINRSVTADFTPDEVGRLGDLGIIGGKFSSQTHGLICLTEKDVAKNKLWDHVQGRLYDTLFPPDSRQKKILNNIEYPMPQGETLHLCLELSAGGSGQSGNVQLFLYPWELLCHYPARWPSRNISISRHVRCGEVASNLIPVSKLRILFIISRPKDRHFNNQNDKDSAVEALKKQSLGQRVIVEMLPEATIAALDDYLFAKMEENMPHIIHFDGHGVFGRLCGDEHYNRSAKAEYCEEENCKKPLLEGFSGLLAFEHPTEDKTHWVRADYLAQRLLSHGVKLFVLNTCKGGLGRHGDDIFNGVAQNLIRSGIPAVIASSFQLDSNGAVEWTAAFYPEVAKGKTLVEAVKEVRKRFYGMADIPREWYRPALYLRQQDREGGRLFEISFPRREIYLVYIRTSVEDSLDISDEYCRKVEEGLKKAVQKLLEQDENVDKQAIEEALENIRVEREGIDESKSFEGIKFKVKEIDWRQFQLDTFTNQKTWEESLLPNFKQSWLQITQETNLICLGTQHILSIGFAFGYVFRQTKHPHRLAVVQRPPFTTVSPWLSDDQSIDGQDKEFALHLLPGSANEQDSVIIICADPDRSWRDVVSTVGKYWGEQDVFKEFVELIEFDECYSLSKIKEVLTLMDIEVLGEHLLPDDLSQLHGKLRQILNNKPSTGDDFSSLIQELATFICQQNIYQEFVNFLRKTKPSLYRKYRFDLNKPDSLNSKKHKAILLLKIDFDHPYPMSSGEAVELAKNSCQLVETFVQKFDPEKLHLFLSVPFGLATFLGHYWYGFNRKVQCYEQMGSNKMYTPTCLLNLSQ